MISTKLEIILIGIVIVSLVVASFLYSKWRKSDNDLTVLKNSIKVQKNINDVIAILDPMVERENSLYPGLYKKLEDLKNQYIVMDNKQKQLKTNVTIRKEKENEFSKANLNTLSSEFNSMGFSNTIIRGN